MWFSRFFEKKSDTDTTLQCCFALLVYFSSNLKRKNKTKEKDSPPHSLFLIHSASLYLCTNQLNSKADATNVPRIPSAFTVVVVSVYVLLFSN